MRTPHGDADVALDPSTVDRETTPLAAVIDAVTGQAVPAVAAVDGRTVDTSWTLLACRVVRGSVVDTTPSRDLDPATVTPSVELVQLAGPGTGRRRALTPGRFHLGPGRRAHDDELADAAVDRAVFEVTVSADDGTCTALRIAAEREPTTDGGQPVEAPITGDDTTTLVADGRAYRLARAGPNRSDGDDDRPIERDGTMPFVRTGRRPDLERRVPVLQALDAARGRTADLWQRRPADLDAFVVPFGYRADAAELDDTAVVAINLLTERGAAIAGTDAFRLGLARALTVELCTLHGPADVSIIVATHPDRADLWDWAKWLPHCRSSRGPRILTDETEIGDWATSTLELERHRGPVATRTGDHLTVVIVDNEDLWIRRESPLRHILTNPPPDVRMIVATEHTSRIPAVSTAVVSQLGAGLARYESFTSGTSRAAVLPALVDIDTASSLARPLAALDDVEADEPQTGIAASRRTERLVDLLSVTTAEEMAARWIDRPTSVEVGRRDGSVVTIEIGPLDRLTVAGSTIADATTAAVVLVAGIVASSPPTELAVVQIVGSADAAVDGLADIAHCTAPQPLDEIDTARLIDRIEAIVAGDAPPARVVVIIDAPSTGATLSRRQHDTATTTIERLDELARRHERLQLVVVTDAPVTTTVATADDPPDRVATVTAVRRPDGLRGVAGDGRAFLWHESFDDGDHQPVVAVPFVVARAMTPLEQRLHRRRSGSTPHGARDRDLAELAAVAARAAARHADEHGTATPTLVERVIPAPFTPVTELEQLLVAHEGDAIPLGTIDRPATGRHEVLWWEPGPTASLLCVGSPRSGVDAVLSSIVVGLAERVSATDVRVLAVDPSAGRRRAIAGLPHADAVAAPDDQIAVGDVFDRLATWLEQPTPDDGRHLVVMLHDVGALRRAIGRWGGEHRFDQLVGAATMMRSRVALIATVHDAASGGLLSSSIAHVLVGAQSAPDGSLPARYEHLLAGAPPGRCVDATTGDLIQLARITGSLEAAVAARIAEPTQR